MRRVFEGDLGDDSHEVQAKKITAKEDNSLQKMITKSKEKENEESGGETLNEDMLIIKMMRHQQFKEID